MSDQPVPRRKFLKTAVIVAGASTAACCGLGYVASQAAPAAPAVSIETPSYTYGEESMQSKGRILVAYATRTGSTTGVAAAIGETLAARGYLVDVKPFSNSPVLADYQAVVLGSVINGGQWLPEASEYVRAHQVELKHVSLALFCVHIMNLGDDEQVRQKRLAYLDSIRKLVSLADEDFFAGMGMDPEKTSFVARWAFKLFNGGDAPEGDNRDWHKIHGWAQAIFNRGDLR